MFRITTDNTADLTAEYIQEHNLFCMSVSYILDGITYGKENQMDWKEFYQLIREGILPTTSQVNPADAKECFEEIIKTDKEILHIAFSSGLSGTYNSLRMAAEEVMEEHPDVMIIVVDSLCASLGQGLLVHKAVKMRDAGRSMEETAEWLEKHKLNLVHIVTVDDLNHLYRGGRVSKTSAVIGTLAGIKPMIHVDNEGRLIVIDKIRGRKKALNALVDYFGERAGTWMQENKDDYIFISHSDALEDAEYVREQLKVRFGMENFIIHHIGPTIGAHTGCGTVALFFMGESR